MATIVTNPSLAKSGEFGAFEKYMIRRLHPRRIFIDMGSLPWVVYFIWEHEWIPALLIFIISAIAGFLATSNINVRDYSRTLFGRIALLHLHMTNMILQSLGALVLIWALWTHSTMGILSAISLLFWGHLAGWDEVWKGESSTGPQP